jgi:hypothetical protein
LFQRARRQFASFVASEGLSAELVAVAGGVPHRQRIDLALEHGGGRFGVLEFFGIQTPVIARVPRDRSLPVYGFWMLDDEFSDRWRWITVEIADGETARSEEVGLVFVDEARLMFAGADALREWCHQEAIDGLADYVFWGRDAEAAAAVNGAPELTPGEDSWVDLPVAETVERGAAVEESRDREGWMFAGDFRPHSHHYKVLRQMRASPGRRQRGRSRRRQDVCLLHQLGRRRVPSARRPRRPRPRPAPPDRPRQPRDGKALRVLPHDRASCHEGGAGPGAAQPNR